MASILNHCFNALAALGNRTRGSAPRPKGRRRLVRRVSASGATHFLIKTLPKVAAEMALHVLAYNLTRVMNIIGIKPLIAAIRA